MSTAQVFSQPFGSSLPPQAKSIVFVVGEDESARESLAYLARGQGWKTETYRSTRELLAGPLPSVPHCLILALPVRHPGNVAILKEMRHERAATPIIMISDLEDVPATVQAMKAGAVDFFVKPWNNSYLVASINESLERSSAALAFELERHDLRCRYSSLTRREREVMALVIAGLLNKQVGGELGISEITVKAHRGQVMQKMKANSLADLVRMAAKISPRPETIHLA